MGREVTLDAAMAVIAAAQQKAKEIGVPMNVAVVDAGANLTAFARMDGAWLGSIEISRNKAYTARAFDLPTGDWAKLTQPGAPAYGIAESSDHRIAIFPGGIPLKSDGKVVGGVGASGGLPDQDQAVAEAGAQAFLSYTS
ncbi:MAG: GlcG/HbpS family heme-binding protein [Janthinobacterium lividum]